MDEITLQLYRLCPSSILHFCVWIVFSWQCCISLVSFLINDYLKTMAKHLYCLFIPWLLLMPIISISLSNPFLQNFLFPHLVQISWEILDRTQTVLGSGETQWPTVQCWFWTLERAQTHLPWELLPDALGEPKATICTIGCIHFVRADWVRDDTLSNQIPFSRNLDLNWTDSQLFCFFVEWQEPWVSQGLWVMQSVPWAEDQEMPGCRARAVKHMCRENQKWERDLKS